MIRSIVYKYIDPNSGEHYMSIVEPWNEVYDGPWVEGDKEERVIEIRLASAENYLR